MGLGWGPEKYLLTLTQIPTLTLVLVNFLLPPYTPIIDFPFSVDELLQKLTDLQSAVNTGKDSL